MNRPGTINTMWCGTALLLSSALAQQAPPKTAPTPAAAMTTIARPQGFEKIYLHMPIKRFLAVRPAVEVVAPPHVALSHQHPQKVPNRGNLILSEAIADHAFLNGVNSVFLKGRLVCIIFTGNAMAKDISRQRQSLLNQAVARYGEPSELRFRVSGAPGDKAAVVVWRQQTGSAIVLFKPNHAEKTTSFAWFICAPEQADVGRIGGSVVVPTTGDEVALLTAVRDAIIQALATQKPGSPAAGPTPENVRWIGAIPAPSMGIVAIDPAARELFERAASHYHNVQSLSLTITTRDLTSDKSNKNGSTLLRFQHPDKLRLDFTGENGDPLFLIDGKFSYRKGRIDHNYVRRSLRDAVPDFTLLMVDFAGQGFGEVLRQLLQGKSYWLDPPHVSSDFQRREVKHLPETLIGNRRCEGIRFREQTTGLLYETVAWFDVESGLLVRTQQRIESSSGKVLSLDEVSDTRLDPVFDPNTFRFQPEKDMTVTDEKGHAIKSGR